MLNIIRIKEKMYDPSRVKYEYASLTDSMIRVLVGTKQEFNEDLVDYTKRFKQAKDIFKQSVGDNILDNFIEHTKEYKDTSDVLTRLLRDSDISIDSVHNPHGSSSQGVNK